MEKIKLEVHKPQPRASTPRIVRHLESILHMELSLSIARAVLNAVDANITSAFTVDLVWNGKNAQLTFHIATSSPLITFLSTYPNMSVGPGYLVIGERSGPCVIIFIERCVSEIDRN